MKTPVLLLAFGIVGSHAVSYSASSPATLPSDPPFTLTLANGGSQADRATLTEIFDATVQVVSSDRFAERLAGLGTPSLWLSATEGTLPPSQVLEIYLGRHDGMRQLPTTLRVKKGLFGLFGPRDAYTTLMVGSTVTARITLTKWQLSRWRSGTPEGRSCAVNTMAHELAHTIWDGTGEGNQVFTDRGHEDNPDRPMVSYVVGSVAQCTMLENQGALSGSFSACVEKWGTTWHHSGDCE